MNKPLKSLIRDAWRCVQRLVRALPLMRYGAGQHDLICDATGTGKDYYHGVLCCVAYHSRTIYACAYRIFGRHYGDRDCQLGHPDY